MRRQKAKIKRQKAKGRHFLFLIKAVELSKSCFCLLIFAFCLLPSQAWAATPLENYVQRLEEAAHLASDIVENDYNYEQEAEQLRRIADLVPKTEDVARDPNGKDLTHVDNAWVQQSLENLEKADEDKRYEQLVELATRLGALSRSLRATLEKQSLPETSTARERLQQILARGEYQPEEEKDSAIQGWLKKIRQKINEWLAKLFFGKSPSLGSSPGSLQVVRWIIILALVASLVWATILLLRRFQLRQIKLKGDEIEEVREILGEQLDADVTADDLLKAAADLARQGQYRLAIRRAYLALLYELEQRGKLHLHRAKTNRDYLNELRAETLIHPPVTNLTNAYERVWYGDGTATMDDYAGFIDRYREVVR